MPMRCIHSRSSRIPSLVTLPFIQCHQTRGFASLGGVWKPASSGSDAARSTVMPDAPAAIARATTTMSRAFDGATGVRGRRAQSLLMAFSLVDLAGERVREPVLAGPDLDHDHVPVLPRA